MTFDVCFLRTWENRYELVLQIISSFSNQCDFVQRPLQQRLNSYSFLTYKEKIQFFCVFVLQIILKYLSKYKRRYLNQWELRFSGIIFIRNTKSKKIGKSNNLKVFVSKNTQGPKQESQIWLRNHPLGRRTLVLIIHVQQMWLRRLLHEGGEPQS